MSGRALSARFVRGARDLRSVEGPELDREKVEQVLMTECRPDATGGELPWRTDFGTPFHMLRHQNVSHVVVALARVWVRDAVRRWLPRVALFAAETSVTATELRVAVKHAPESASAPTTTEVRRPR